MSNNEENNANDNTGDQDDVSPSKRARDTSFQCKLYIYTFYYYCYLSNIYDFLTWLLLRSAAFSNLKKSEFFSENLSVPNPENSTPSTSSRTNSVLVSPKQVMSLFYIIEVFIGQQKIYKNTYFVFQKGNPLLKFIINVPWEYSDIVPDYVMGKTTCALFLSIRYHQLNPDYIHERLKLLGNSYNLRVLLVQVYKL